MLLEAEFNLGEAIKCLFPNAIALEDFVVMNDSESSKLMEWNLEEEIPTLEVLRQAYINFNHNPLPPEPSLDERVKSIEQAINDLLLG